MAETLQIREEMERVRQRGLVNAQGLSQEVERLSDWREHVRAHPVPIALAAIALGYWLVPNRRSAAIAQHIGRSQSPGPARPQSDEEVSVGEVKAAGIASLGSAAMGFVGSLIGNAVRSYVSEQVHSLINPRVNDATSRKW